MRRHTKDKLVIVSIVIFGVALLITLLAIKEHPKDKLHKFKEVGSTTAHETHHHYSLPSHTENHSSKYSNLPVEGGDVSHTGEDNGHKHVKESTVEYGTVVKNKTTSSHHYFKSYNLTIDGIKMLYLQSADAGDVYFGTNLTKYKVTGASILSGTVFYIAGRGTTFTIENDKYEIHVTVIPVGTDRADYVSEITYPTGGTVLTDYTSYKTTKLTDMELGRGTSRGYGRGMLRRQTYVCRPELYISVFKRLGLTIITNCDQHYVTLKGDIRRSDLVDMDNYTGDKWVGNVCPLGRTLLYKEVNGVKSLACI